MVATKTRDAAPNKAIKVEKKLKTNSLVDSSSQSKGSTAIDRHAQKLLRIQRKSGKTSSFELIQELKKQWEEVRVKRLSKAQRIAVIEHTATLIKGQVMDVRVILLPIDSFCVGHSKARWQPHHPDSSEVRRLANGAIAYFIGIERAIGGVESDVIRSIRGAEDIQVRTERSRSRSIASGVSVAHNEGGEVDETPALGSRPRHPLLLVRK